MPTRPNVHRPVHANRPAPPRPGDDDFYRQRRWRRFRLAVLANRPLCEDCHATGMVTPATQLHHVKLRKEFPHLAYDESNILAVCTSCHSKRTARGE